MKRKISITVDDYIMDIIDTIAKTRSSKRSNIIEEALQREFGLYPVVILTKTNEKKILENKHLIERQLTYLRQQGIHEIYIDTSSSKLQQFINENYPEVIVMLSSKKTGSGGALKAFGDYIKRPFIFIYGNTIPAPSIRNLIVFHNENASDLTLVLKSSSNPSKWGSAILEGSRMIVFEEKAKSATSYLIFIGMGIINPICLGKLDEVSKLELQLDTIPNKFGYVYEGDWTVF